MIKKIRVISMLIATIVGFSAQSALATAATSSDIAPIIVACNDHAHNTPGHNHTDLVTACSSAINSLTKTTSAFTAEQVVPVITACNDDNHGTRDHDHSTLTTNCADAVNKLTNSK